MAGTTGYLGSGADRLRDASKCGSLGSARRAGAGDIGQGVNLGKASAWAGGSRGPSEPTEKGEVGSGEAELSPEVENNSKAKGLSSGHSHLSILLGENPLYWALGNHH